MTTVLEATKSTMLTTAEAVIYDFVENNRLPLKRETLAIFNALLLTFPKEITMIGKRETFKTLGDFTPVMIACNDYCDIGLALQRHPYTQHNFQARMDTESRLRFQLNQAVKKFSLHHADQRKTESVRNFIGEMQIMSQSVRHISEEDYVTFLEIDSALFEVASIGVTIPSILDKIEFDTYTICDSFLDIKKKYSFFSRKKPLAPLARRIIGLHAVEMMLKVDDDKKGYNQDRILGLPNFLDYSMKVALIQGKDPERVLSEIKDSYYNLAKDMGFSSIVLKMTNLFSSISHDIKSTRSKKGDYSSVTMDNSRILFNLTNTTLREDFSNSGILEDLIRR